MGEPEVPPGWWARVGGLAENHPACEMLKGPFKTKLNRVSNRQTHFKSGKNCAKVQKQSPLQIQSVSVRSPGIGG